MASIEHKSELPKDSFIESIPFLKEILYDLRAHLEEDYNFFTYIYLAAFLVVSITINYSLDFEHKMLDFHFGKGISLLYYTLFYATGYYGVAIPQQIILGKSHRLLQANFWIRSLFLIFLLGFHAYFYFHNGFKKEGWNGAEIYFVKKILIQLKPFVTIIFPLLLFWLIFDRKNKTGPYFYGLKLKGSNLRPYGVMLLIMTPLIIWASFQTDFLSTYPILKPWRVKSPFGLAEWQQSALFEPFYGVSFFSVELIFRGALVIGMARILGKDAILPMVSLYAFLHFGKPMGETIGSIYGGYILGVIALRSKHIFGGCLIHIGVAYLMELTALMQHYIKQ